LLERKHNAAIYTAKSCNISSKYMYKKQDKNCIFNELYGIFAALEKNINLKVVPDTYKGYKNVTVQYFKQIN